MKSGKAGRIPGNGADVVARLTSRSGVPDRWDIRRHDEGVSAAKMAAVYWHAM
jgi:hypothetical protein